MHKLVHVYGVVVSKFWNAKYEVRMLIIQLYGGGGVGIMLQKLRLNG